MLRRSAHVERALDDGKAREADGDGRRARERAARGAEVSHAAHLRRVAHRTWRVLARYSRAAPSRRRSSRSCSSTASPRGRRPGQETADGCRRSCRITAAARRGLLVELARGAERSRCRSRFGGLPDSTIAVGHSLGGLVARQWSRSHRTRWPDHDRGTESRRADRQPHQRMGRLQRLALQRGRQRVLHGWATCRTTSGGGCRRRSKARSTGAAYIANFSIYHLLIELGMQFGVPFVQEVYVGSPYLDSLNGGVGWEAANIPSRVGIVNTASEYWRGGPFRLKDPDYAGELSILDQHRRGGARLLGVPGLSRRPTRSTTTPSRWRSACWTRRSGCGTSTSSGAARRRTIGRSGRATACPTTASSRPGASSIRARR